MQHWKAKILADELLKWIDPYVTHAEVVGSIRRGEDVVKDVDLVILPHFTTIVQQTDLWGTPVKTKVTNNLISMLKRAARKPQPSIIIISAGEKRITLQHTDPGQEGIKIELYMVPSMDELGIALMIRTGPAAFSKAVATWALERHFHITKHRLHTHEKGGRPGARRPCTNDQCPSIASTVTEDELFSQLGLMHPRPEIRSGEYFERMKVEAMEHMRTNQQSQAISTPPF